MKTDRNVRMLKFSSLPGFADSAVPFLHNSISMVTWSHRAVFIKFQCSLHDEVPVLFLPTNFTAQPYHCSWDRCRRLRSHPGGKKRCDPSWTKQLMKRMFWYEALSLTGHKFINMQVILFEFIFAELILSCFTTYWMKFNCYWISFFLQALEEKGKFHEEGVI